jgi:hypothetical protein
MYKLLILIYWINFARYNKNSLMRLLLYFFIFLTTSISAQVPESISMNIKKAIDDIKLDGILTESSWKSAELGTNFWMKFPTNDSIAKVQTEVQYTYNEKYLYISLKVYESKPGYMVSSLKRDIGLRQGDGVGIVIDPVGRQTNGFYFSITPYNSQSDALVGGGFEELGFTWDNKWYSATKVYDLYWTAEMAIPFDILRYDDSKLVWNFNLIRSNRKDNEFSTLAKIPLQFRGFDLGYSNKLVWDQNPPKSGNAFVLNPYAITTVIKDKTDDSKWKANAGGDAKFSLSSSLNLDLTFNPDFSNVDVDNQVTNLTRFNIFFPERRVFFLENDDLFSSYGNPDTKPFYSRRIGSKDGQSVPIYAGARLTGNISKNTRVGLMNIQTGRKGKSAADNFTAVSVKQSVMSRSTIGGYFNNRNAFMSDDELRKDPGSQFSRNYGTEFNYSNKEGTINGWSGYHVSAKPGVTGNNTYYSVGGGYFKENFNSFIDFTSMARNYFADMGFINRVENYDAARDTVIRIGYKGFYNETGYTWYKGSNSKLNRIELETSNYLVFDDKNNFNERINTVGLTWGFKNTAEIGFEFNSNTLNLLFPFKFVDDDKAQPLPAQKYNYNTFGIGYQSDARKNFFYELSGSVGTFYNAKFQQISGTVTARNQPYISFGLNVEYNSLNFPVVYGGKANYLLLAPRIEWNFSNNLFWTTFVQYNTQADNFNVNSRLQWRFTPMSDLFLVYSDDYITDLDFKNNSRAIAIKANYWLNSAL